jgi:hypothetical protein
VLVAVLVVLLTAQAVVAQPITVAMTFVAFGLPAALLPADRMANAQAPGGPTPMEQDAPPAAIPAGNPAAVPAPAPALAPPVAVAAAPVPPAAAPAQQVPVIPAAYPPVRGVPYPYSMPTHHPPIYGASQAPLPQFPAFPQWPPPALAAAAPFLASPAAAAPFLAAPAAAAPAAPATVAHAPVQVPTVNLLPIKNWDGSNPAYTPELLLLLCEHRARQYANAPQAACEFLIAVAGPGRTLPG